MASADLLTPGLGAEYINDLVRYGRDVFKEHLRLLLVNAMQDGYLMFTEPPSPEERKRFLQSPEADQRAAMMIQDKRTRTPDARARSWR